MNKLVSIIILSYNNLEYIYQAIDSVLSQDYPNIEIIISDDGSKDFNLKEIQNYISNKKNENIKAFLIMTNKFNNEFKNSNKAIKECKGDYIIFLAADDMFYSNNVISKIIKYLDNSKLDIVTCKRKVYSKDLSEEVEILPTDNQISKLNLNPKDLYKYLCRGNFISGSCTYYTKDFFNKYGLFDERIRWVDDYCKYLNITRNDCKVGYLDIISIKYRLGGISTSSLNQSDIYIQDMENIYKIEIEPYV